MQVFIELTLVFLAAIIFVALCSLATWIFQSVFHYDNSDDQDLRLFSPEDDEPCLADDTLQYPLQHPTEYTDYR